MEHEEKVTEKQFRFNDFEIWQKRSSGSPIVLGFRHRLQSSLPAPPSLLLAIRHRPHSGVTKRAFDVALSGVGLILSLPLWAIFAVAVKLEDGGPIFYGHIRVGQYGRRFKSWKFRSMAPDAHPQLQAQDYDSRITKVGRFLRATAMDELPQLWNIFVGEMSFVGPRPLIPEEIETNGHGGLVPLETVPGYRQRHQVRPGLTGLAQIYAPRDVPRRRKFRYDRLYIQKQKFWLDLELLVLSFWITLRGKWEDRGNKI